MELRVMRGTKDFALRPSSPLVHRVDTRYDLCPECQTNQKRTYSGRCGECARSGERSRIRDMLRQFFDARGKRILRFWLREDADWDWLNAHGIYEWVEDEVNTTEDREG